MRLMGFLAASSLGEALCRCSNQINARKVEDEYNVFQGILKSRIFIYIWISVVAVQACTAMTSSLCMRPNVQ